MVYFDGHGCSLQFAPFFLSQSYCQKHSVTSKKEKSGSASEDEESKRKKRKDMTSEEKNQARAAKYVSIVTPCMHESVTEKY
jgi:hypothetical protein